MSKRARKIAAPFVLGAMFIASLFLSSIFSAHIVFVAIATAVSVAVSYLVWPIRLVVVALVMIVVATLLPISAMYIAANSGQESTSIADLLRLVVWWKNAVPLATAVGTAYLLTHLPFQSEETS